MFELLLITPPQLVDHCLLIFLSQDNVERCRLVFTDFQLKVTLRGFVAKATVAADRNCVNLTSTHPSDAPAADKIRKIIFTFHKFSLAKEKRFVGEMNSSSSPLFHDDVERSVCLLAN